MSPQRAVGRTRLATFDLASSALLISFGLFSLIWPASGYWPIAGRFVPRGWCVGPLYLVLGFLPITLGRRSFERAAPLAQFLRIFYPQAIFGPLFREAIMLSGTVNGGRSNDAVFAMADQAIFGFQPAVEFSRIFGNSYLMNEIMFAAYFSFFVIFTFTPWIGWFKGDREEAKREMTILSLYMLPVYIFYVFFRVEGPKYFLPVLHESWYGSFNGMFFTRFFQFAFGLTNLSGAAFPSSHVAVSVMMAFFAARTAPRLLPLYIVDVFLIMSSTVYIYAHWFSDVIGGLAVILVLLPLFEALHGPLDRWITGRRNKNPRPAPGRAGRDITEVAK